MKIAGATAGDQFGYSVAYAGNLDQLNYDDIIIGAPYNDHNDMTDCGAAYIYYGDTSFIGVKGASDANYNMYGGGVGENFGFSVAGSFSIDGDIWGDLIVGGKGFSVNNGKIHILAPSMRDDYDGDGLSNYYETHTYYTDIDPGMSHYTDPLNPDTDGDGLWDGWHDTNRNGIQDPGEAAGEVGGWYITVNNMQQFVQSNPLKKDTDNDGLHDDVEYNGWDITVNGVQTHAKSNPSTSQTDEDGISDSDEFNGVLGERTDPQNDDTDNDGLTDYQEQVSYHTSAVHADTDGDGLYDGFIDLNGNGVYDNDGDGVQGPNDEYGEVYGWYILLNGQPVHVTSNPLTTQSDGDGLSDDKEFSAGSDPLAADRDQDGLNDNWESTTPIAQESYQFKDGHNEGWKSEGAYPWSSDASGYPTDFSYKAGGWSGHGAYFDSPTIHLGYAPSCTPLSRYYITFAYKIIDTGAIPLLFDMQIWWDGNHVIPFYTGGDSGGWQLPSVDLGTAYSNKDITIRFTTWVSETTDFVFVDDITVWGYTDPSCSDTDGDGLWDGWHDTVTKNGQWDVGEEKGEMGEPWTQKGGYGTNPLKSDTDNDRLSDFDEITKTCPSTASSDDDFTFDHLDPMWERITIGYDQGSPQEKKVNVDISPPEGPKIDEKSYDLAQLGFTMGDLTTIHSWFITLTAVDGSKKTSKMTEFDKFWSYPLSSPTLTVFCYNYVDTLSTPYLYHMGFNIKVLGGKTDPFNPDTDGDGILDGDEVSYNSAPYAKDANVDTDRDGLINSKEIKVMRNTLKRDLVAFNIVVGTEWDITGDEFNLIAEAFKKASQRLFDATDGHFLFKKVEIWDNDHLGGAVNYKYLDYDAISDTWPNDKGWPKLVSWTGPGGIEQDLHALHSYVEMARRWHSLMPDGGDPSFIEPLNSDVYAITVAHEFGHLGLFLHDEYKRPDGSKINWQNRMFTLMGYEQDNTIACTPPPNFNIRASSFLSSPLDYSRTNNQFWRAPSNCYQGLAIDANTQQFAVDGVSAWEKVYNTYNKMYGYIGAGYGVWVDFDFDSGTGVPNNYVGLYGPYLSIIADEITEIKCYDFGQEAPGNLKTYCS